MKRGFAIFILVILLLAIPVYAQEDSEDCNFFCKLKTFFVKIFVPIEIEIEEKVEEEIPEEVVYEEVQEIEKDEVVEEFAEEVVIEELQEIEEDVEEIKEDAINQQIEVIEERTVDAYLTDINVVDPACEIETSANSVVGNDGVDYSVTFDEDLKYTSILIYCDQFERYGISSDEGYLTNVPSSLTYEGGEACDWGKVTTPTIYFVMIVGEENQDLCVKSVTALPENSEDDIGEDGCFTNDALEEMKEACGETGFQTTLDANLCETVYCGLESSEISQCPSEGLLEMAEEECHAKGEEYLPIRYSEEIDGQDWHCSQIRCSLCPSDQELTEAEQECYDKGENYESQEFIDHEVSGCSYVICNEKGFS